MKQRYPDRKTMFAVVGAMIVLSLVLQFQRGWDTWAFCLRLLLSGLAVVFAWRCRALAASYTVPAPGKALSGFAWRVGFWVAAAVVLFFGFKTFGIGDV